MDEFDDVQWHSANGDNDSYFPCKGEGYNEREVKVLGKECDADNIETESDNLGYHHIKMPVEGSAEGV